MVPFRCDLWTGLLCLVPHSSHTHVLNVRLTHVTLCFSTGSQVHFSGQTSCSCVHRVALHGRWRDSDTVVYLCSRTAEQAETFISRASRLHDHVLQVWGSSDRLWYSVRSSDGEHTVYIIWYNGPPDTKATLHVQHNHSRILIRTYTVGYSVCKFGFVTTKRTPLLTVSVSRPRKHSQGRCETPGTLFSSPAHTWKQTKCSVMQHPAAW